MNSLNAKINDGAFQKESPRYRALSESAKSLIEGLLHTNPSRRLQASQALNHPWLNDDEREESDSSSVSTVLSRKEEMLSDEEDVPVRLPG